MHWQIIRCIVAVLILRILLKTNEPILSKDFEVKTLRKHHYSKVLMGFHPWAQKLEPINGNCKKLSALSCHMSRYHLDSIYRLMGRAACVQQN